MSGRLLRRVLKEQEEKTLAFPDLYTEAGTVDDEDEDEQSNSTAVRGRLTNPFDLLDGEEDDQLQDQSNDTGKEPAARKPAGTVPSSDQKSKKKKKKNKQNSKVEVSIDSILKELSINTKASGSNSFCENASEVHYSGKKNGVPSILVVDPKFLKAENELRKRFGSKVVNSFENQHGVRRHASYNFRKTFLATPLGNWDRWDHSLTMELLETKDGVQYFRYVHTPSYKDAQVGFVIAKAVNDRGILNAVLAHTAYHIDALLIYAEYFKYSGEHQKSTETIEKCLYALECAWHPLFTPLQGNCQLKYNHDTNKPLFLTLFGHMKNMDRRGCHRSALEVCKLLLSLDSDDPKGALFCIDYFSLRAQEYRWLEQFVEEYRCDDSLWLFPNFSYSLAVARLHLEHEDEARVDEATSIDLMKQALMLHPSVLLKLVSKAPMKEAVWTQILKHPFFGSAKVGSPSLEHLINIYVERSYILWRFPQLQKLLKDAAFLVIESLKENSSDARDWDCVRKEAFSSEKNEYSHLMVSDFSDVIPTIPPEEIRDFMVGGPPQLHEMQDAEGEAIHVRVRAAPRDVVGRNAAIVFLESLLPWADYGVDRNREPHGHDQDDHVEDQQ